MPKSLGNFKLSFQGIAKSHLKSQQSFSNLTSHTVYSTRLQWEVNMGVRIGPLWCCFTDNRFSDQVSEVYIFSPCLYEFFPAFSSSKSPKTCMLVDSKLSIIDRTSECEHRWLSCHYLAAAFNTQLLNSDPSMPHTHAQTAIRCITYKSTGKCGMQLNLIKKVFRVKEQKL